MSERWFFHGSGRGLLLAALAAVLGVEAAPAPATSVNETEPNDSLEVAQLISLGDTVNGTIDPVQDLDFFAIDLEVGTVVDVHVVPSTASPLAPYIAMFAADGSFLGQSPSSGAEVRLLGQVSNTGRYFLDVEDYNYAGGPAYGYRFWTTTFPVDETEPNNTPATANILALGDSVVAATSNGDVDFFAVDLAAGTYLGAEWAQVVDSVPPGLGITIFDTDGSSPLASNAWGDRPRHYMSQAGRYYVATRSDYSSGIYALRVRNLPTGPGDPTTMFEQGLGRPLAAVAGFVGDVYTYDATDGRLLHVFPTGGVTTMASGLTGAALAVDGFGDLLAPGVDSHGVPGILRFTPDGTRSVFAADTTYAVALAVAPDGDVWSMESSGDLRRYGPTGVLKDKRRVQISTRYMAFSPSGVLHFITGSGAVYRLTTNSAVPVPLDPGGDFQALAFDEDGYLYVTEDSGRTIRLYDPSYNVVDAPFSTVNLDGQMANLLFLRDTSGTMTSRLLVSRSVWNGRDFGGALLELNPAGVRAAGNPAQPRLLRFARAVLRDGLVGAPYADTLRLLDAPGEIHWALTEGDLPSGLVLDSVSGVIEGIPQRQGESTFSVRGTSGDRFGSGTFTVAIREPWLAVTSIMNTILGGDLLTDDQRRFLDLQGNQNGAMDIGDVRAYLAAHGGLPYTMRAAPRREGR